MTAHFRVRAADGAEGTTTVDDDTWKVAVVRQGQLTDPLDRRIVDLSPFEGQTIVLAPAARVKWEEG